MQNTIKPLSQHIDTLKTHYYIDKTIEDEDFTKYVELIRKLLVLKKESQESANMYGDTKSINYFLGKHKFNIMPTSIKGFSILLQNADCSIALRQSKNKINPSPSIKIEFRAEFLARKGYVEAIRIINTLVSEQILSNYHIKISEIHLATDIQGYEFNHLDFFRMKTLARKSSTFQDESIEAKASAYGGITTFTGFTYGGGDYHLRVYNKTKEIISKKNKAFAKYHLWEHKENYREDETVWRIEIQIRRAKLKKLTAPDGSSMDDYINILNNIPSLWKRALEDYTLKDFSEKQCFDLLRGKRTLKSGVDKLLTKNAIYKIYNRTQTMPLWDGLKEWNGYTPDIIGNAPKVPKIGNFMYVENSIKSLLSTMAKHYGSTTPQTMITAFKDANQNNIERNQIGLIESTYDKQLDWIELIEGQTESGLVPEYKELEREIFSSILFADSEIRTTPFSKNIISRVEARQNFARSENEKVQVRDLNYLQNLIDKSEAKNLF